MYRVTSPHSHYLNTVGEKVGTWHDGRIVLQFKKGQQCAYLPKNLELVRLVPCSPGSKGCRRTMYYEVVCGRGLYRGQTRREVRGLRHGKVELVFEGGEQGEVPLEYLWMANPPVQIAKRER